MSLVAYASSDESEPDEAEPEPEEEEAAAPTSGPALGGLFASLPAPKGPALLPPPPQMLAPAFPPPLLLPPPAGDPRLQPPPPLPFGLGGFPPPPGVSPAEAAGAGEGLGLGLPSPRGPGLGLPPSMGGAGPPLGLPKPKKRTEPVKIAAPELHQGDVSVRGGQPRTAPRGRVGSGRVGAGLCAGPGGPGTASRTCGRCLRSAGLLRPREPGSALVDSGTCSCGLCRLHPPAEGPRPPRAPTAPAATLRAAPLLRLRLGPLFASRSWRSAKPGEGRSEGGGRAPAPRLDVRAHPSRAPSREAAGPEEERRGGLGLVLRPVRCVLSAERAGTGPPLTAGLGEMTRWCLRGKQGSTVCYLPRGRTQCG